MMPRTITLGTARSVAGSIQYGRWEALGHPTGHTEFLPVVIAQGREDGPCLWLTAGIHGPEQAGPLVLYRLIAPQDLNRLWPDCRPGTPPDPDKEPPSSLETAYKRLFEEIETTADYLTDYHCAWTESISLSFRDRVLYRSDRDADRNQAEARALAEKQSEMLLVAPYPEAYYTDKRCLTG